MCSSDWGQTQPTRASLKGLSGASADPAVPDADAAAAQWAVVVESKMGAVAWGQWPTPRFPSPLIEPEVPISGVRLSDWLHCRPTARHIRAGVRGAERQVLRKQLRKRTGEFRALPLCAVA